MSRAAEVDVALEGSSGGGSSGGGSSGVRAVQCSITRAAAAVAAARSGGSPRCGGSPLASRGAQSLIPRASTPTGLGGGARRGGGRTPPPPPALPLGDDGGDFLGRPDWDSSPNPNSPRRTLPTRAASGALPPEGPVEAASPLLKGAPPSKIAAAPVVAAASAAVSARPHQSSASGKAATVASPSRLPTAHHHQHQQQHDQHQQQHDQQQQDQQQPSRSGGAGDAGNSSSKHHGRHHQHQHQHQHQQQHQQQQRELLLRQRQASEDQEAVFLATVMAHKCLASMEDGANRLLALAKSVRGWQPEGGGGDV